MPTGLFTLECHKEVCVSFSTHSLFHSQTIAAEITDQTNFVKINILNPISCTLWHFKVESQESSFYTKPIPAHVFCLKAFLCIVNVKIKKGIK